MQKVIVALGGNAIQSKGEKGSHEESYANVEKTMRHILPLIESPDYEVVITHGNGPQVGNILIQNAMADEVLPPMPMFVCGAESQGQIGFWIQQSLKNIFLEKGLKNEVATVVTQVEVDENSDAFKNPSKPVGPFYAKEESERIASETGFTFKEDAGRGYRRVVPSPIPINIVEIESVKALVEKGITVITSGGGGIPVINVNNKFSGVDAVIDKDRAAALLGHMLNANLLIILTAVDKVAINYGKENEQWLDNTNVEELTKYLGESHFAPGSMGPKVEAVIEFLKGGSNRKALITSPDKLPEALEHKTGTWIG